MIRASVLGSWLVAASLSAQAPVVTVTVDPVEVDTVQDRIVIRGVASSKVDVNVLRATLELPDALAAGRPREILLNPFAFDLNADEAEEFEVEVPSTGGLGWQHLFFICKERKAHIRLVMVRAEPPGGSPSTLNQPVSFNPKAPLLAVVVGGILGVVFQLAFSYLFRKQRNEPVPTRREQAILLGLGVLVVVALAAVSRYAEDIVMALGISVEVCDIRGGVAFGLAFQSLAKTIAEKFGLVPKAAGPAAPSGAGGNH